MSLDTSEIAIFTTKEPLPLMPNQKAKTTDTTIKNDIFAECRYPALPIKKRTIIC